VAMYNYDAEYDSFSSGGRVGEKKKGGDETDDATVRATAWGRARPRYIAGLLRTARRRNWEHKVVHERRVGGPWTSTRAMTS
jgi:hypothetical protein